MKIFDMHLFLGKSLFGHNQTVEDLHQLSSPHELHGAVIPLKPYDYLYPSVNADVAKIATQGKNWQQVLRVDPWRLSEAIELIQNSISRVLYLHPFEEQFYPTHENVKRVIEEASGRNMKIMIASGYLPFSHSAQVWALLKDFPKTIFIITHGGQINVCGMHMQEAFEIFTRFENTFFETSGIYREDYIEEAIDKLGSDRVIFGSGAPYYDFKYEIKRMEFLRHDDTIKEKVIWHNGNSLFR